MSSAEIWVYGQVSERKLDLGDALENRLAGLRRHFHLHLDHRAAVRRTVFLADHFTVDVGDVTFECRAAELRLRMPDETVVAGPVRDVVDVPGVHRRAVAVHAAHRSEEHTSELQSLMRISYAVFCL